MFAGGAETAAESAHRLLWEKYVGPDGLILDYSGEIPSPKDIEDGVPNFLSWWSPIENGAKFTGLYIAAACRRAEDTGNESDIAKARKLAKGLMLCASVSDVKGFVARGVGTDGKSHYPFGSEDQTVPWLYGMYSYYKSRIPSEAERAEIRKNFPKYAKPSTPTHGIARATGSSQGIRAGTYRASASSKPRAICFVCARHTS